MLWLVQLKFKAQFLANHNVNEKYTDILDILSTLDLHIGGKSLSFQRCPNTTRSATSTWPVWPFFNSSDVTNISLDLKIEGKSNTDCSFLKPEPYTILGPLQLQILHWWGRHRACDKATVDGQQHPANSQSIVQIPWDTVLWSAQLVQEFIHQQEKSCVLLTMPARMEDFITLIGHGTQLDSEEKQPTAPHCSGTPYIISVHTFATSLLWTNTTSQKIMVPAKGQEENSCVQPQLAQTWLSLQSHWGKKKYIYPHLGCVKRYTIWTF